MQWDVSLQTPNSGIPKYSKLLQLICANVTAHLSLLWQLMYCVYNTHTCSCICIQKYQIWNNDSVTDFILSLFPSYVFYHVQLISCLKFWFRILVQMTFMSEILVCASWCILKLCYYCIQVLNSGQSTGPQLPMPQGPISHARYRPPPIRGLAQATQFGDAPLGQFPFPPAPEGSKSRGPMFMNFIPTPGYSLCTPRPPNKWRTHHLQIEDLFFCVLNYFGRM